MTFSFSSSKAKKRDQVLAIDLGARQTKAVLVQGTENGFRLLNYAIVDTPASETIPSVLVLSEILRSVVQKLNTKIKQVTLTVGSNHSILRNLELPLLPIREIRQMLKLNPKSYFHQDLRDYVFDCFIVPPPNATQIEAKAAALMKYNVWVGAMKQQLLKDLQAAIRGAGLVPDQIALGLLGPVNAFEHTEKVKGAVALVDLGYSSSSVSLLRDNELYLNRVVDIGGHKITAGLAEAMGISYSEAEGIKVGIPEEVMVHLQPLIAPLGREIRASVDFFEHQNDSPVSQVYFSGGAARSELFLQNLQNELMIPCKNWNPVSQMELKLPAMQQVELEKAASQLAVVIGAATASF